MSSAARAEAVTHTYDTYGFASVYKPETIAAYSWTVDQPRGAVFIVHGIRAHTRFNFLRHDSPTSLCNYGAPTNAKLETETETEIGGGGEGEGEGEDKGKELKKNSSMVRELNARGLSVYGHDHVGHGESTGERVYFPKFQTLVDDLLSHIRLIDAKHDLSANKLPVFLLAHSLGGTVAIAAARDHPTLFTGMALSSAATEPPANMFGIIGRIQSMLSGVTSALIPKTVVVPLPRNEDSLLQLIFEADPLNSPNLGIRARVGREILTAYKQIANTYHQITVPFITAVGERDTVINPAGAKRFYERTSSADKTYHLANNCWHDLLFEQDYEKIWKMFADWISDRAITR